MRARRVATRGSAASVMNALRFMKEGQVDCVKMQGGRDKQHIIKAIADVAHHRHARVGDGLLDQRRREGTGAILVVARRRQQRYAPLQILAQADQPIAIKADPAPSAPARLQELRQRHRRPVHRELSAQAQPIPARGDAQRQRTRVRDDHAQRRPVPRCEARNLERIVPAPRGAPGRAHRGIEAEARDAGRPLALPQGRTGCFRPVRDDLGPG